MHYIVTAEFSDGRHENRTFESRAQAETSFQGFSYMSKCNNAKWSRSDTGEVLGAYIAPLPTPAKPPRDGIALQNAEFDAFAELAKQVRRHHMTPVVDDDYPEVRHDYERALRAFLAACKANGRTL